jgi:magnesium transporter
MTAIDALADALLQRSPQAAAITLERFDAAAIAELLAAVPAPTAAAVLRALSLSQARAALQTMPEPALAGALGAMPAPRAAALLRGAAPGRVDAVLAALSREAQAALRTALDHRPGSAGALATPTADLAADLDAAGAIERLRAAGHATSSVPVVDRDGRLVGLLPLAALLTAPAGARVGDLPRTQMEALHEADGSEAVAAHPGWHTSDALPVVGADGVLLGVITLRTLEDFGLAQAARASAALGLPVALAELFWIGLRGITDGIGRTVSAGEPPR